eukprot:scaffold585_cov330-Pavlova_lutheri.AAC.16
MVFTLSGGLVRFWNSLVHWICRPPLTDTSFKPDRGGDSARTSGARATSETPAAILAMSLLPTAWEARHGDAAPRGVAELDAITVGFHLPESNPKDSGVRSEATSLSNRTPFGSAFSRSTRFLDRETRFSPFLSVPGSRSLQDPSGRDRTPSTKISIAASRSPPLHRDLLPGGAGGRGTLAFPMGVAE